MKLHLICKYAGMLSGGLAGLFMLFGVIGFFTGEFLNVARFSNWFWFANTLLFFAIFCMLVFIGCKDKQE